jgi:hypothetical protein
MWEDRVVGKLNILFAGMIVCAQLIHAQVQETAMPFLEISPDSRSSGMGEAGVALIDNTWAGYWNPAGYAFQQEAEIAGTYSKWLPSLGLPDLWIAHLVSKQPVKALNGVVSAMVTYLNLGKFEQTLADPTALTTFHAFEMAFTVGYAAKVLPTLGLGLNARYIYSKLAPTGLTVEPEGRTASGVSFDIGLLYKPESFLIPFTDIDLGKNLRLGMDISNIGPNIYYIDRAQKDPLPMNLRLGFAYDLAQLKLHSLTWVTDVNRLMIKRDTTGTADEFYKAFYTTWTGSTFNEQIREFTVSTGLEYWYGNPKLLALRIGYFYEDPRNGDRQYKTFGAGFRYDICRFDFSYISAASHDDLLDETLRFSFSIVL